MTEGQKRPKGQKRGCGKSYKEKLGTMPSFFCTYLSFVAHVSFVSFVFHASHDRDQPQKNSEPPVGEAPKSYWLRPEGLMPCQILD